LPDGDKLLTGNERDRERENQARMEGLRRVSILEERQGNNGMCAVFGERTDDDDKKKKQQH
jgi:hypothetical protein